MPILIEVSAKVVALSMIGARIAIFLAILPQFVLRYCGDSFTALIGCTLGVAGYAYSVFVFQRVESHLFYHSDWKGSGILLRQRFRPDALYWHRDLILLCTLAGLFGAGVGWNVRAITEGNLVDARIIAAVSIAIPLSLVLWLYRGTSRYRIDLPATD